MGAGGTVGRDAVNAAAVLILRGLDPRPRLQTRDPVEAALMDRAAARACELRQRELDYLAQETANRIAKAFGGK